MRRERRSEVFIQHVLLWHVFEGTMLPIMWEGIRRLLAAILPMLKLGSKITIVSKLVGR